MKVSMQPRKARSKFHPFLLLCALIAMPSHSVHGQEAFSRETFIATGKSNIYFFRAKRKENSGVLVEISLGGRKVGLLNTGEYFVLSVRPGSYTLHAYSPAGSSRRYVGPSSMDIQPNLDYFVEVRERERTDSEPGMIPVPIGKSLVLVPISNESTTTIVRTWEITSRSFGEPPAEAITSCRKVEANP